MSARIDIVNQSLILLGAETITSLEDEAPQAKIMKDLYYLSRDATLEAHEWSFAIKRFQPAQETTDPLWGWSYSYPIPSDIMRVLRVDKGSNSYNGMVRNEVDFALEGRSILTNDSPIYCTGIRRIEDEGIYSNLFCDAFSAKLALKACTAISEDNTNAQMLAAMYAGMIKEAKSRDGQQGTTRRLRSHWLDNARRGFRG